MKVKLVYAGNDKTNKQIGDNLAIFLRGKKIKTEVVILTPKAKKKDNNDFTESELDVKEFDLVIVGTPVRNFSPMPMITDYLRLIKNSKGKNFFLFSSCVALPGTTLKRMSNIVTTKSAKVSGAYTLRSLFEIDEKKMKELLDYFEKSVKL